MTTPNEDFPYVLCIPSATQHYYFRTFKGAEAYINVYAVESGKGIEGTEIRFDGGEVKPWTCRH